MSANDPHNPFHDPILSPRAVWQDIKFTAVKVLRWVFSPPGRGDITGLLCVLLLSVLLALALAGILTCLFW